MRTLFYSTALLLFFNSCTKDTLLYGELELKTGWKIQSSTMVKEKGAVISTTGYQTKDWYCTNLPSTVFSALNALGEYKNVYYDNNLEKLSSDRFLVAWWYRTEFEVSNAGRVKNQTLVFYGLNYKANIWFNGELIANADTTESPFRIYKIDVSTKIKQGKNTLAVEVFPPKKGDLTIGFVDWNPPAPDNNMGLWRGVKLETTGAVSLNNVYVRSNVDTNAFEWAKLSMGMNLYNYSTKSKKVMLVAEFDTLTIQKEVIIQANSKTDAVFTPDEFKQLVIDHPRLWWPNGVGKPELYTLKISALINGSITDSKTIRFGIRTISQFINADGHKGFMVNGKKIMIKGAGWVDDMTLSDNDEKVKAQIEYVKHMNLNTIRLEGFWGNSEKLYDYADENGLLVMLGLSCHWEWEEYCGRPENEFMAIKPTEYKLHEQAYLDQVYWLRNHPSVFLWVFGSDKLLPTELEKMLTDSMALVDPTRPILASCKGVDFDEVTKNVSKISGPAGVKMRGPYEIVTPNYWYIDKQLGGAFGFNTETGPGAQIPPLESLQKMIPADSLWPPTNDSWNFHCGRNSFSNLDRFLTAFNSRYGESSTIEDFAQMCQVSNYEAIRPMYEAFEVNKYHSTGVIQWMLNSAWPEMFWQQFDWYLMPNGAFYGTRNACRPLNVVYNYANKSIYVTSDLIEPTKNIRVEATVYDINSKLLFNKTVHSSIEANSSLKMLDIASLKGLSTTYFLNLKLYKEDSTFIADNFYWLSTREDIPDFKNSSWFETPNSDYADLKGIRTLKKVKVDSKAEFTVDGDRQRVTVTLTNRSSKIAFFLELAIKGNKSGETILPVFWDNNYVSLMPGEVSTVSAWVYSKNLDGQSPKFELNGVNLIK